MFSIMELRLIRHSTTKEMENLQRRLKILDKESDDAVEAINDLMMYQGILDKIKTNPAV